MSFKNPIVNPLTENQENLLSQLGSFKNILTVSPKKHLQIPEDNQISTFDYLLRIAKATAGDAIIDIFLKKFIDDVFSKQSSKLEIAIIKGVAKSLDAQGKTINNSETNEQWLLANALPSLHLTFEIAKALMIKQIIAMIFDQKEKMVHDFSLAQQHGLLTNDNYTPNEILDNVIAAESMFSISNSDNNQFGDQEYNSVKLRERLEKGQVIFTISCQDVKISLPETFDTDVNNMISNIVNTNGVSAGGGQNQIQNPSMIFDYISTHVASETQRINTQENSNATKKNFLQILIDKIFNLLLISISPFLTELINKINTENPTLNLTIIGLISSPKELKDLSNSDKGSFDTKSIFASTLINVLYSLLLSIILKVLIKEVKKLIKNALAKKSSTLLQSKFKRLQAIKNSINNGTDTIEKAKQAADALKQFDDIFNFSNLT